MSDETQSTLKLGLLLSFAAFVLIVIVFRTHIKEIEFGKAKATLVTPQEVKNLSEEQRSNFEQELLRRVSDLKAQPRVENRPSERKMPVEPASQTEPEEIPNLTGNWMSPTGLTYEVNQTGNAITIKEVNPLLGGVTAVAVGYVYGRSFSIPAYTILGTNGTMALDVSNDGHQMSGAYRDNVTGGVVILNLSR